MRPAITLHPRSVCRSACLLFLLAGIACSAQAQLLYSFESGLDGFVPTGQSDSDYINHFQTTTGATNGVMAMGIESGAGFGRDVQVSESIGSPAYDLFNTVAANPGLYTLDFDVTFTTGSWANLSDIGSYLGINLATNSDAGFMESYNVANGQPGLASIVTASVPASQISLAPNSSFYQLQFGSNGNQVNGAEGQGAQYFIDNVRFTAIPQFTEKLLFSWETPDNPSTPGVNEQLEGWRNGFDNAPYFHTRAISSEGATQGASALQFTSPQSGYAWGSQVTLDSGATGDPANQPLIDELISSFNSADKIAFDVTFPDDQFPYAGSYLSLFLNVSDQAGTFYQSSAIQAGNPVTRAGQTQTLEVALDQITAGTKNLAVDGLTPGTFFRLALATNSNDGNSFFIDNIRLLSLVTDGLDGDFNEDGVVDAADYTVWRDNLGAAAGTLPNDPNAGVIGAEQYTTWKNNFGASAAIGGALAGSAVPEPSALASLAAGLMALAAAVRGRRVRV
ncbi:hypothetical protein Pla175_22290 [Pirellulimonas nuda]|uniref:PEP-CTERM protein-sorting domain-containing protein n=1 Tax=Pirellulimonas nuda TaxID=2528009 RepID=A0A518DBJ1_9BACT|nr:PEP-CTERM sorting domain-containing protein [Pirellulimonas nuda]QDU88845.1 hypothetical protein Pla175_22290 [Pirellulimonas nuda]